MLYNETQTGSIPQLEKSATIELKKNDMDSCAKITPFRIPFESAGSRREGANEPNMGDDYKSDADAILIKCEEDDEGEIDH